MRHVWQAKSAKPHGARDLARPHAGADHRAGNVDTNWHTQTTQLCAALTMFQHAETAAQNGGSARVLPDFRPLLSVMRSIDVARGRPPARRGVTGLEVAVRAECPSMLRADGPAADGWTPRWLAHSMHARVLPCLRHTPRFARCPGR
jgi:hypothetical protein